MGIQFSSETLSNDIANPVINPIANLQNNISPDKKEQDNENKDLSLNHIDNLNIQNEQNNELENKPNSSIIYIIEKNNILQGYTKDIKSARNIIKTMSNKDTKWAWDNQYMYYKEYSNLNIHNDNDINNEEWYTYKIWYKKPMFLFFSSILLSEYNIYELNETVDN